MKLNAKVQQVLIELEGEGPGALLILRGGGALFIRLIGMAIVFVKQLLGSRAHASGNDHSVEPGYSRRGRRLGQCCYPVRCPLQNQVTVEIVSRYCQAFATNGFPVRCLICESCGDCSVTSG